MYQEFKLKNRVFRHIQDGWCARSVDLPGRTGTVWRMFWGTLKPGAPHPSYVSAYVPPDDSGFVDFDEYEQCVRWVGQREGRS